MMAGFLLYYKLSSQNHWFCRLWSVNMSDHRDTLPDASLRMSTEIQPAIESQSSAGQYTDYPSTDMSGKRRNPAKKAKVVISDNDTSDEVSKACKDRIIPWFVCL
jgi:hypothetical protein